MLYMLAETTITLPAIPGVVELLAWAVIILGLLVVALFGFSWLLRLIWQLPSFVRQVKPYFDSSDDTAIKYLDKAIETVTGKPFDEEKLAEYLPAFLDSLSLAVETLQAAIKPASTEGDAQAKPLEEFKG